MPQIFDCDDLADVQAALAAAPAGDVDARMRKPVTVPGTLSVPNSNYWFRFVEADPTAKLDFAPMLHPTPPQFTQGGGAVTRNGIEINSKRFSCNVRCANYNEAGALFKANASGFTELYDFKRLIVENCGTHEYAYRNDAASTEVSNDTVYTEIFGIHDADTASLLIDECTFISCAKAQWDWGHVCYVDAGFLMIRNCEFVDCGSPWALYRSGGYGATERALIIGNTIRDPALIQSKVRVVRKYAYAADITGGGGFHVAGNRFIGTFNHLFGGYFDGPRVKIEGNKYHEAQVVLAFAINLGVGNLSWSQWRALGHDIGSTAPLAG